MKFWHINVYSKDNMEHMINRNMAYIGLGNDKQDYEQRIHKNKLTTPWQFKNFNETAKMGDWIFLYRDKIGYIVYGIYSGKISEPTMGYEFAPDWSKTEIQKHIIVDTWIPIKNPTTKFY